MTNQTEELGFYPNPAKEGHWWTTDGYLADLGWNPYAQLEIRQKKLKERIRTERPMRAYDDLDKLHIYDAGNSEQELGMQHDDGAICAWCWKTVESVRDLRHGACIQCLYRICKSCGQTYEATNKSSVTCSSECAEILRTKRGRWMILERDEFTCIYCGKSAPLDTALLHVDHIVPVKDGGKSVAANLITSCKTCNLEKSANRMSNKNESEILEIAQERNLVRGIENSRVLRIRASDV